MPIGDGTNVRCSFCGHDQVVSPKQLAELRRYRHAVGALGSRIDHERAERVNLVDWYGADGKGNAGVRTILIYGSPLFALLVVCAGLVGEQVVDPVRMWCVVAPALLIAYFVIAFVLFPPGGKQRDKRAPQATAPVTALCPHCGGPLPFDVGEVGRDCPHCGGAVVADAALINGGLDAARNELRAAAIARYRLERRSITKTYRSGTANKYPYLIVGSFLVITCTVALVFTFEWLAGDASNAPGPIPMWLPALANVAVLINMRNSRRRRRYRFQTVADELAEQLDGHDTTRVEQWVNWLNRYWVGPYPVNQLFPGPHYHAVCGRLETYPVAMDLDPVPINASELKPRADVFVAAQLPVDKSLPSLPRNLRTRALRLGFTLLPNSAGFIARSDHAPELWRQQPLQIAQTLLSAASVLVEWAKAAEAAPARRLR